MTEIKKSERELAGAGYVISFFADIEILIANAANYINNITRMKLKYGEIDEKTEMDPSDKIIIDIVENVKGSVFRTYIKFTALKAKVKDFKNLDEPDKKDKNDLPTVEDIYKKIREQSIPKVTDVEDYCKKLNILFVSSIDILTTAQTIYEQAGSSGGPGQ